MTEVPLNELEVGDLVRRLHHRDITAVALAEACLAASARVRDTINAHVALDEGKVIAEARALDDMRAGGVVAGPLHGIPVAVKDNFWTRDYPTTACSRVLAVAPVGIDATVVGRLRAAGAIVFGKTNMHEWAYGATNTSSAFGPVHNPWNPGHISGGSSGGSAAALAARVVPAALGSDTGGSVRIPAAACGVCGLKPTYGRLSRFGVLPLSFSLDVAGPMARSARDLEILLDVLSGEDPKDPTTRVDRRAAARSGNPRLAVLRGEGILCDEDVGHAFENALGVFREAGCTITEIEVPGLERGFGIWKVIMLAEASAWHARYLETHVDSYGEDVRIQLQAGQHIAAVDYLKAQQFRTHLVARFRELLEHHDAACMPTLPVAAPAIGETDLTVGTRRISAQDAMTVMPWIANLTGLPAVSIPSGRNSAGLPVALTLMGRPFGEETILDMAGAFQSVTGWHTLKPDMVA
ncbi:MAG: amidase [bacterium]|nr:amidase [bacterium]MDE0239834.1 amidase [bacterium]MDE0417854.1 amidase [bacterium]